MDLCNETLWQSLCQTDDTATFYQTPTWLKIGAEHYKAELSPLYFESNGIQTCLPLLKKARWGSPRYFSPFGTYAALLCPTRLDSSSLKKISSELAQLPLHLISSPFTRNTLFAGNPTLSKVQLIDLKTIDPKNIMRDWEEGQRRRVRVAQRNQVTVRQAETQQDWDRYFDLYELSLRRWGKHATSVYPKKLFDSIRNATQNLDSAILWLAEYQGKIGAGYLTFYHKHHVVPWHGAADSEFFQWGATQALFYKIIDDAMQRGFDVFDLTGSAGLSGVESFKSRFGTKTVEYHSWLNRPGLLESAAKIRDGFKGIFMHKKEIA